jgi:hypothetical protein
MRAVWNGTSWGCTSTAIVTYTPALAFGAASTGITYSRQFGQWYQVGRMTYFNIEMALTSKGSATGTATISLPSTATENASPVVNFYSGMTTFTSPIGFVVPGSATFRFSVPGSTSSGSIASDTNFSDTSSINVSGWYY